jgi:hypothetical protein
MSYFFRMECRRWAPLCDAAGSTGLPFSVYSCVDVGLTGWTWSTASCRDAGESHFQPISPAGALFLTHIRIVEYATREQAQQAIQTLSNQSLMGRLVYVREVRLLFSSNYISGHD